MQGIWKRIKRKSFLALRQLIKRKIKQSYHSHLEGLLGLGNNDQSCDRKKLFSFLKNSRQDQQGPTPLQNNGKLTSDITDQCNVHNQQFQAVFILDRHLMTLGPSCPNLGRDVLKNMGRVVLVRDFIWPSGLVRVVFGPSCLLTPQGFFLAKGPYG